MLPKNSPSARTDNGVASTTAPARRWVAWEIASRRNSSLIPRFPHAIIRRAPGPSAVRDLPAVIGVTIFRFLGGRDAWRREGRAALGEEAHQPVSARWHPSTRAMVPDRSKELQHEHVRYSPPVRTGQSDPRSDGSRAVPDHRRLGYQQIGRAHV